MCLCECLSVCTCMSVRVLQHCHFSKLRSTQRPLSHPETTSLKTTVLHQKFCDFSFPLFSLRGPGRCAAASCTVSTYRVTSLEFPFYRSSCCCINTTSSLAEVHSNTIVTQQSAGGTRELSQSTQWEDISNQQAAKNLSQYGGIHKSIKGCRDGS